MPGSAEMTISFLPHDYLFLFVVIKCKKETIMERTIQNTLKRWETSLKKYGKVDQWSINDDYCIIREFITYGKSKEAQNAVRECRDYSISSVCDASVLLIKVQNANRILNKTNDDRLNPNPMADITTSQAKRYESTTKKLYKEKLRFKKGQSLKDIDISIEDGETSRKVRRIVEKRMCQAYHRQHKHSGKNDTHNRHNMKRATSYQLHNLGLIEYERGFQRSESTHWKKTFDPILGERVLKKKTEYSSYEEAADAAIHFALRHPNDERPINAYKCSLCGKWHIGHSSLEHKTNQPNLVALNNITSFSSTRLGLIASL